MKKRVLIVCTGNSCRSQMAEGWLKSFGDDIDVFSAGTDPAPRISVNAARVMREVGIELGDQFPKSIEGFLGGELDYLITVCDNANETCPAFTGKVRHRLHVGFEDPSVVTGTEEEIMGAFRKTRNEIGKRFRELYEERLRR